MNWPHIVIRLLMLLALVSAQGERNITLCSGANSLISWNYSHPAGLTYRRTLWTYDDGSGAAQEFMFENGTGVVISPPYNDGRIQKIPGDVTGFTLRTSYGNETGTYCVDVRYTTYPANTYNECQDIIVIRRNHTAEVLTTTYVSSDNSSSLVNDSQRTEHPDRGDGEINFTVNANECVAGADTTLSVRDESAVVLRECSGTSCSFDPSSDIMLYLVVITGDVEVRVPSTGTIRVNVYDTCAEIQKCWIPVVVTIPLITLVVAILISVCLTKHCGGRKITEV